MALRISLSRFVSRVLKFSGAVRLRELALIVLDWWAGRNKCTCAVCRGRPVGQARAVSYQRRGAVYVEARRRGGGGRSGTKLVLQ